MEKFENFRKVQESMAGNKSGCNCRRKLDPYQLFDDNVEDISKSLAQIMLICGINTTKSYQARSIIKRAFVYHEKLRTKCPPEPKVGAHLNRDDMLQALRLKCSMERVEAMLSYAIIKRAFKAFFHGKPPTTVNNPIVDVMAVHGQESAWMHAAYKTARIFDNYKAAFFWAHKCYEKQITLVYSSLYKRMVARADPLMIPGCPCHGCRMQEVPGYPKAGEQTREIYKMTDGMDLPEACILCGLQVPKMKDKGNSVRVKPPRPILNHDLNLPRCEKCNSPFLICDCNIDQLTGEQYGECGQDSYKVKWYRLEQEKVIRPSKHLNDLVRDCSAENENTSYEEAEEPSTDWENHHCPIDCKHNSCSDSSNVCPTDDTQSDDKADSSSFTSCTGVGFNEDIVAKLENYLNKLWAEEVAEKKNPLKYKSKSLEPPRESCGRCQD